MMQSKSDAPPRLARWLLAKIISDPIHQEVAGDFYEIFQQRKEERGKVYARFCYWLDVLDAIRNIRLRRAHTKTTFNPMIAHFFKISLRNLRKNKGYPYLNILGLLAGALSALIILQYVGFERSFDSFHENKEALYRLQLDFVSGERVQSYATTYAPLGELMESDFPDVVGSGRMLPAYGGNIYEPDGVEGARYKETRVFRANQGLWDIFSFQLVLGNESALLTRPNTAIISRSLALKYFGTLDVLGKVMVRNGQERYELSGVFEDLPANSHLQFDMLLALPEIVIDQFTWRSYGTYNYLKVRPGADIDRLAAGIENYMDQYRKSPSYDMNLLLQPMLSLHFDQSTLQDRAIRTDKSAVDSLYIMAIVIMVIAFINFVNLSSATALTRGKEAAMRKVFGSKGGQMIIQGLSEAFIIHCITWLLAIAVVYLASPFIAALLQTALPPFSFDAFISIHLFLFLLLGALGSGLYPAMVLRSFRVSNVIHGRNAISSKGAGLRKILVVVQYAASMALIIITLVVFGQIDFMRQAELGVKTDQTVVIHSPATRDSTIFVKLETLKQQWLQVPGVTAMTYGQDVPGSPMQFSFGGVRKVSETVGNQFLVTTIEPDYADFYGLEFIAGRNVSHDLASDVGKVYINESALALLGFNSPEEALNQELNFPRENVWIVGVVKDFHIASVKEEVDPSIFHYRPEDWPFGLDVACIRIAPSQMREALQAIEDLYYASFPGDVFDYFFLDRHFEAQYQADIAFGRLFGLFAILAIIIASLGLFGLTSFSILKRLKEMSIRKVLGAGPGQIIFLFSKSFLSLLFVSVIIAIPLSYLFLENWLNGFAMRLGLQWHYFVTPLVAVLVFTFLLISWQILLAARKNPSRYLRME